MFNIGDMVKIGSGKVEYVVAGLMDQVTGEIVVESMNTGKPKSVEAARLTLLRAADTDPMNEPLSAPQDDETPNVEGEPFDPRTDRRQSAYGLAILAAVMRKNPAAGAHNVNPLKPIGSKRSKVRSKVRAQRTAIRKVSEAYNDMRRHGYNIAA